MFNLPDLRPLFYLAMFGLAVIALIVIVGIPAAIWWAVHHIAIV